eukprot:13696167-Alexandrium_andersonii.AAC.1
MANARGVGTLHAGTCLATVVVTANGSCFRVLEVLEITALRMCVCCKRCLSHLRNCRPWASDR